MAKPAVRVIAITGATRGLGRALAEGFAALGHSVAGCGRSRDEIDALGRALKSGHDFSVVDVTRDHDVRNWSKHVVERFGAPDLLLNNAALINRNARLWDISADEFDRVIDVNLKGVANVIRHVVPAMLARGSGVIVNLSSGWGRSTSPEVAPYCATKWGIEGLTRAMAQELPKGLAAVALNPGIIDTDMLRSTFGSRSSSFVGPEDWAKVAMPFLLKLGPSDNGKSLTVPGQ